MNRIARPARLFEVHPIRLKYFYLFPPPLPPIPPTPFPRSQSEKIPHIVTTKPPRLLQNAFRVHPPQRIRVSITPIPHPYPHLTSTSLTPSPPSTSYVVLTAAATTFLGQWHGFNAGLYRRAAQLTYPTPYASESDAASSREKYLFNCAQRAHANYVENHAALLAGLLIAGLKYPLLSAGMGVAWCVARVMYAVGYVSPQKEGGKGRLVGSWFWLPQMGLGVMSGLVGWSMLGM